MSSRKRLGAPFGNLRKCYEAMGVSGEVSHAFQGVQGFAVDLQMLIRR
jgi:hypothetical protein